MCEIWPSSSSSSSSSVSCCCFIFFKFLILSGVDCNNACDGAPIRQLIPQSSSFAARWLLRSLRSSPPSTNPAKNPRQGFAAALINRLCVCVCVLHTVNVFREEEEEVAINDLGDLGNSSAAGIIYRVLTVVYVRVTPPTRRQSKLSPPSHPKTKTKNKN